MKKIIKKALRETLEDKKLQMAHVYLSNYLGTLEEVVKDNGNIYLRESGDEFSEEFSLQESEVELLITKWVEDAYQLKGINAIYSSNEWMVC